VETGQGAAELEKRIVAIEDRVHRLGVGRIRITAIACCLVLASGRA